MMNGLGIGSVIVPIDDGHHAERALPYAEFLARRLDAEIRLLAVAATPEQGRRLERAVARAHLTGRLGNARVAYDFARAARIVAADAPAHACVATDWPTPPSVARQIVFDSDGPVVLVGPPANPAPTTVPDRCIVTARSGHGSLPVRGLG